MYGFPFRFFVYFLFSRGGNYDPFTSKWVDFGYVMSPRGQKDIFKHVAIFETGQMDWENACNFLIVLLQIFIFIGKT